MMCAHCGPTWSHRVLVGMAPGRDGQEWWLCRRCWADGLRTRVAGDEQPPVQPSAGERTMTEGTTKGPKKRSTR